MGEALPAPAPARLVSIDVLRGGTMAAMIVVNNPGSWGAMFAPLRHAGWGDWLTPADFVFPFFLFLVGASVPLALGRRLESKETPRTILRGVARRAAILFAIGLFLNLFPQFDLATVRIPGVLQRIALVYLACSALYVVLTTRGLAVTAVALLLGYSLWLELIPVPGVGAPVIGPEMSWPVWLDERLLGAHTWRGPGDPEGLLSTLPAIATGLAGLLATRWMRSAGSTRSRARGLAFGGLAAVVLGALLTLRMPLAKEIWSSSYALVTAGAAATGLSVLHAVLDDKPAGTALRPLLLLGRQALLAYVLAHLLSDLSIHILKWPGGPSLHVLVYRDLLASWLPATLASLVYSAFVLAAVYALVAAAEQRGLRLKV